MNSINTEMEGSAAETLNRIDAFLDDPGDSEDIETRLDAYSDLVPSNARAAYRAAFKALLPENDEWQPDDLSEDEIALALSGLEHMQVLARNGASRFRQARIMYLRGCLTVLIGEIDTAKSLLLSAHDRFPEQFGRHRAGALLQLGNLLIAPDAGFKGYTAAKAYEQALACCRAEEDPALIGEIQQALGLWLCQEGRDEENRSFDAAIRALEASIPALETAGYDEDAAISRVYLAFILTEQSGGNHTGRIERAIACAEDALTQIKRSEQPVLWGMAQSVLGCALQERSTGNREHNLREAERCHRASLRVYQVDVDRDGRIRALINLSAVAIEQAVSDPDTAAERAIRYCQQALALLEEDDAPELVTNAWLNLSSAYGLRQRGSAARNASMAEHAIRQAHSHADHGQGSLDLMILINHAAHDIERYRCFGIGGIETTKRLLIEAGKLVDPEILPLHWLRLRYHQALIAAFRDEWAYLLEIADEVASRTAAMLTGATDLDDRRRILAEITEIGDLGVLAASIVHGADKAIAHARRQYDQLTDGPDDMAEDPAEGEAVFRLLGPQIDEYALAILSTAASDELIQLSELGFSVWHDRVASGQAAFLQALDRFRADQPQQIESFKSAMDVWISTISTGVAPLTGHLQSENVAHLMLQPHGGWNLAPFSALDAGNDQFWGDRVALAYGERGNAEVRLGNKSLLHIVHPDIAGHEAERAALEKRFEVANGPVDLNAIQALLSAPQDSGILHFTCHGSHDFQNIDDGGIICPDNRVLSARWIYEHAQLRPGTLVVIAACETGLSDFQRLPNEPFGLPGAFLKAGAGAVLSTLWPVDDLATRLLVEQFYDAMLEGKSPSRALQMAQQRLRAIGWNELGSKQRYGVNWRLIRRNRGQARAPEPNPFAHPLYWAGYVVHQA